MSNARRRRQVIYCADVAGTGGALRHRDAIVRLLQSFGWTVDHVHGVSLFLRKARDRSEPARTSAVDRVARTVALVLNSMERACVLVARALVHKPDVILWRPGLFQFHGYVAAVLLRVPLVVEVNAPAADEADRFGSYAFVGLARRIERHVLARADQIVAVSETMAEVTRSAGRCVVVPNGGGYVDDDEVAAAEDWGREQCPLCRRDHGPAAVILESFRGWHGAAERRAAVGALPSGWTTIVIGDGPGRDGFVTWATGHRSGSDVVALGRVEPAGVQHVLSAHADLGFVLYPSIEPFYFSPLKLFDFLAHGIPVVATDIGQIASVARDAEAAVELVPPGDPDTLKRAVRTMAEQVTAMRVVPRSRNWPQLVLTSSHGWRQSVRSYARVLEEAAGGCPAGHPSTTSGLPAQPAAAPQ